MQAYGNMFRELCYLCNTQLHVRNIAPIHIYCGKRDLWCRNLYHYRKKNYQQGYLLKNPMPLNNSSDLTTPYCAGSPKISYPMLRLPRT